MAYLTSGTVIANLTGASANASGTFDSGATGTNRLLVVAVIYENGGDPGISGMTYNSVSLTKETEATVSAGDNFSETVEVWYLANPTTGSNTLQLTNSSTAQDFMVLAAVYTGRNQTTPLLTANTVTIARPLSEDGTLAMTKPASDDEIFWTLVQDRNLDTVWTPEANNTVRLNTGSGGTPDGFNVALGDMLTGSGSVTAGATQTGTKEGAPHDLVGIGVVMQAAATDQTVNVGPASETSGANAVSGSTVGPPVADITHVASEEAAGDGTSAVVAKPTGTTSQDVGLIVATGDSSSNSITLPSGWTQLFNGNVPNLGVGPTKLAIGYRVMTASEPASWTVTYGASDSYTASISVWRGVDNSTTLDVAFAFVTADSGTIPLTPNVTTVTDGAALITVVGEARGPLAVDMDYENYYQAPVGHTEVVDVNWSAGSGYTGHAVGWELIAAAGATGTRDWTSIDEDDGGFAASIVLRPAETVRTVNVGPASETDAAASVAWSLPNTLVLKATEASAALPLRMPRTLDVTRAQEGDTANPVAIDLTGAGTTGYTDFTEYSVALDILTDDWSLEEGGTATLTVQSDTALTWGRRVRFDLTDAGSHSTAVWTDAPAADDWDVLILTRRAELNAHVFGAAARWNQAADTGYIGGPIFDATNVTIRRQTPTGTTTVLDAPHRGIVPEQYFWLRLRIRGTTTQLRVWQANTALEDAGASAEPTDWDIDTTDAVITGSGIPGIHFRQVGTSNRTMDVGWFSYGTGTRIAPSPFSQRTVSVGLATETSDAKAVLNKLASRINSAVEADTANPVLALHDLTLDLVTGADAATVVTFQLTLVVHTATETSTATPILAPRTLLVGLASEASTAGTATAVPARAVGTAFETSTAISLGGAKVRSVGQASESSAVFSINAIQTSPELINRARDYQTALPVQGAKVRTVGQATEASVAVAVEVSRVRLVNVGQALEVTLTFAVAHDRIGFVGTASEVARATPLTSGLPPFWWRFYDQADGKPAKRRLRPLVFTDDQDGQHYIIMRNSDDNLIRLEPFEPGPYDEVYSEYGGPTIKHEDKLYRLYVSGGVLHFERSLFEVRTRPILFGKVARPTAREPRYELVMLADTL